jgi:hypothetical protein
LDSCLKARAFHEINKSEHNPESMRIHTGNIAPLKPLAVVISGHLNVHNARIARLLQTIPAIWLIAVGRLPLIRSFATERYDAESLA